MKQLNLALVLLLGIWLIPPSVLAEVNLTQIGTIAVDEPRWMAMTPDGSKLYVVNGSTNISVVDTKTNTVVATIPLVHYASAIAITPDGRYVYYILTRITGSTHRIDVLDTSINSIITTVPINDISVWGLSNLAITPDGSEIYVSTNTPHKLIVISAATNTVVDLISLANGEHSGIAITPDGSRAYAVSRASSTVSVIDIATRTVMTTIQVSNFIPSYIRTFIEITPDGNKAYITYSKSGSIAVIDTNPASSSFNQEIGTISTTSTDLGQITIASDGKMIFVVDEAGEMLVIDTDPSSPTFHTQIGSVKTGNYSGDVVVSPNSSVAYVSNIYDGTISVIGIERVGNSTDDCWAIYDNGNLHIPCIKVKGPSGEEWHYEGDMQYEPLSEPMTFQVTGVKPK